MHKNNNNSIAR